MQPLPGTRCSIVCSQAAKLIVNFIPASPGSIDFAFSAQASEVTGHSQVLDWFIPVGTPAQAYVAKHLGIGDKLSSLNLDNGNPRSTCLRWTVKAISGYSS
jgi:hypothetical protein